MSNLNFSEFPVFPLVTYDKKYDSPGNAKWKVIVSIPQNRLEIDIPQNKEGKVYLVNDEWGVIVWLRTPERASREGGEITLYEASKGKLPISYHEIGNARIQALRGSKGISLIDARMSFDMVERRRYSGAIVEREQSIQIWLRLSEPEDRGSPTTDATASASPLSRKE